jgi:CRISPR-associated protein Cmr1
MEGIPNNAFPRAALGLPIIFHFRDGRAGDPPDTTLYPKVHGRRFERMASPLIIKALGLADGRAVPIVLRLRTPTLEAVRLEGDDGFLHESRNLRGGNLAGYANSPMAGTPSGSALDAFMNFI